MVAMVLNIRFIVDNISLVRMSDFEKVFIEILRKILIVCRSIYYHVHKP